MENDSITIRVSESRDLKATVSGSCTLPDAEVTVVAWLKSCGRKRECYGSCTAGNDGAWSLADFRLLRPEYWEENDRICCLQAVVRIAGGILVSPIVETTVDIPYTVSGDCLQAGTCHALVCALRAAPRRSATCRVRLDADLTATERIVPPLACTLDGADHTITCLSHSQYVPLFGCVAAGARLQALNVVYPAWGSSAVSESPSNCFAGIVRENCGTIDRCSVRLDISQEQIECAGIAFLCSQGGKISNCTVSGKFGGRSAAGIVHTLSGGCIEGCSVKADLEFAEFGGGIVVSAEAGASVIGCRFEGRLTDTRTDYVATRLCGGIAARCTGAAITRCRADVELDLLRSAMGGHAGGVVGSCSRTTVSQSGAGVKAHCHWFYGGIAGRMRDGSAVEQCAVFGSNDTTVNRCVVGGLVADLGPKCVLRDSYDCQHLGSTVYGGGLVGYNPSGSEGAVIERCYTASTLRVKRGGGIKMSGGVQVVRCAVAAPILCGTERMARIGDGGGVSGCVAYDGIATDGGVELASSGESLIGADGLGTQALFDAMGWDFSAVWEMSAEGRYPKLRNLAYPQSYPFSFLRITFPSAAPYVFGTDETVRFEGYVCTRAAEVKNRIEPVPDTRPTYAGAAPVVAGKWSFAVGRLVPGAYRLTQVYRLDGRDYTQVSDFTVS